MTYALTWVPRVLRDVGLIVEEQQGWEARGHGNMGTIRGVMLHHTAGPLKDNMPSLNVVTNGRPGLSGPLANLCLGRDGTYYMVAAGRCWHAGKGEWKGVTSGNSHFIGIEAENTGLMVGPKNDYPWPEIQMESYLIGTAALLRYIGKDSEWCMGHKEYALPRGRKIDPTFEMKRFREDLETVFKAWDHIPVKS